MTSFDQCVPAVTSRRGHAARILGLFLSSIEPNSTMEPAHSREKVALLQPVVDEVERYCAIGLTAADVRVSCLSR